MSETKLLNVKSALKRNKDESDPIALFEQNSLHPNGEAYVAGFRPVKVYPTPEAIAALRAGRIVEVDEEGEALENPTVPAAPVPTQGTPIPDDFPHRGALSAAGITTFESLKSKSKEEMLAIQGLDEVKLEEIAAALPKA